MAPDFSETLKAVNEFYFNAWSMLIGALSIMVIIGAGAIPLFTLWLQRKALKVQEESFMAVLKAEFKKEKAVLMDEMNNHRLELEKSFQNKFDDTIEQFEKRSAKLETGIFCSS